MTSGKHSNIHIHLWQTVVKLWFKTITFRAQDERQMFVLNKLHADFMEKVQHKWQFEDKLFLFQTSSC